MGTVSDLPKRSVFVCRMPQKIVPDKTFHYKTGNKRDKRSALRQARLWRRVMSAKHGLTRNQIRHTTRRRGIEMRRSGKANDTVKLPPEKYRHVRGFSWCSKKGLPYNKTIDWPIEKCDYYVYLGGKKPSHVEGLWLSE